MKHLDIRFFKLIPDTTEVIKFSGKFPKEERTNDHNFVFSPWLKIYKTQSLIKIKIQKANITTLNVGTFVKSSHY